MPSEWLTVKCKCGKTHSGEFTHYQIVRAKCGRSYWALQPKRNGPMKLFLHPESKDKE